MIRKLAYRAAYVLVIAILIWGIAITARSVQPSTPGPNPSPGAITR